MTTNHGARVLSIAALTLGLALPGCMADTGEPTEDAEVAAIAEAIELENGGIEMTDELPAFGEQNAMEQATLLEEDLDDPYLDDVAIKQLKNAPDAVVFHTLVLWGQFPLNLELQTARNWSGVWQVNRGAMLVNKAVAFESKTDQVLPRPDAQTVPFASVTLPHHDGLRLTIIDPTPLASEPLVLTYATKDGPVLSLPIKALVGGPIAKVVDKLGNQVVGMAMPQPVDLCAHGMLGGKWHEMVPGRGKFHGPVRSALGDPIGHVRGIYGVRKDGKPVFFAKYINSDGKFMGILAGAYGKGQFAGKWLHKSGEVGKLGGHYQETIPGPETGGFFLGGWAETSCDI